MGLANLSFDDLCSIPEDRQEEIAYIIKMIKEIDDYNRKYYSKPKVL